MPRLPQPWTKKRGGRTLVGGVSSIVGETLLYASILAVGVFGLTLTFAVQLVPSQLPTSASPVPLRTGTSVWIFGAIFLAAIITGATRLIYRLIQVSASTEYRKVLAGKAGRLEKNALDWIGPEPSPASQVSEPDLSDLPNVPGVRSLNDSPGEHLKFRLAPQPTEDGLVGLAILTMVWNIVWFILLAIAVVGFWTGNVRPILSGLLIPLGYLGYWSFRSLLTLIKARAGVGPTIVEISDHPLYPGGSYKVYVIQMGRMRLRTLTVRLVCEEETFFRQGTDVRVERCEVFAQEMASQTKVRVDQQAPWEQQFELPLAADVMHSLVGMHNAIRWKIVVSGESRPWPSFCRSFPIVVHPPQRPLNRSPR
jgi:hypothetical protein